MLESMSYVSDEGCAHRMLVKQFKLEDSGSSCTTKEVKSFGMICSFITWWAPKQRGHVQKIRPSTSLFEHRFCMCLQRFQDKGTDWRSYLTLGWQLASRVKHSLLVWGLNQVLQPPFLVCLASGSLSCSSSFSRCSNEDAPSKISWTA